MQFWVSLFTITSWQEATAKETIFVGFNDNQKKLAKQIQVGDILLAYLTKVSRFVAILKVTQTAKSSEEHNWSEGLFPVRVQVEVLDQLPVEEAIPFRSLTGRLSFLQTAQDYKSSRWTIHIRSSPRRWSEENARAVWDLIKHPDKQPIQKEKVTTTKNERRPRSFKNRNLIKAVSGRTKVLEKGNSSGGNKILSSSKVTGYAVNFPIYKTCKPTEVCIKTCYFAVGLNTSTHAISHQLRNYRDCTSDPIEFAERIIREYDNNGLTFLRWNGGGDLFEEAIISINHIGKKRPDIVLWIVSRIPTLACKLSHFPNHFIHISLDRSTFSKKTEITKMFNSQNQFFSYQVHPEEKLDTQRVNENSLIFMHDYGKIPEDFTEYQHKFCPLNGSPNIDNTCEKCRRCFR